MRRRKPYSWMTYGTMIHLDDVYHECKIIGQPHRVRNMWVVKVESTGPPVSNHSYNVSRDRYEVACTSLDGQGLSPPLKLRTYEKDEIDE